MKRIHSIEDLWSLAPGGGPPRPADLSHLPEAARRYLAHAIAPGTPLATAVRLTMHGEIKLRQWMPFQAEQVIHAERGMIWKARVGSGLGQIRGSDRLVDGHGAMNWRILGMIPVVRGSGPDISRAGAGRVAAEMIWLPSALLLAGRVLERLSSFPGPGVSPRAGPPGLAQPVGRRARGAELPEPAPMGKPRRRRLPGGGVRRIQRRGVDLRRIHHPFTNPGGVVFRKRPFLFGRGVLSRDDRSAGVSMIGGRR